MWLFAPGFACQRCCFTCWEVTHHADLVLQHAPEPLPGPRTNTPTSLGGPSGAVVVQRATALLVLLQCVRGPNCRAGPRRCGAPLHHHQFVWAMASRSGHHSLPLGSGCPPQAAPQFCHPGHELCAKPEPNWAAKERRKRWPSSDFSCGPGSDSLWDHPALRGHTYRPTLRQERNAGVWDCAYDFWGQHGSGCGGLRRPDAI